VSAAALSAGDAAPADPLREAIVEEFVALVGWNWMDRTISFPSEHPLLGWRACVVASCGKPTTSPRGLCHACAELWRRAGQPDLAEFAATTTRKRRRLRRGPCSVTGCQRPLESAETSLCLAHYHQYRHMALPVEQFRTDGRVRPHPPAGVCGVVACDRDRSGNGPYCRVHSRRRTDARKADPNFDEDRWRQVEAPIAEDNHVCLLGLPDQIALEVLYGLQARTDDGFRTDFSTLRQLVDRARGAEVGSLRELPDDGLSIHWTRPLRNYIVDALKRRDNDPLTSWDSDHWNLRPLGHTGTLRFDSIHQPWLREATKRWVFEELPKRRGPRVDNVMKGHIGDIARFSTSLARHRADGGRDPRALSRTDVTEFPELALAPRGHRHDHQPHPPPGMQLRLHGPAPDALHRADPPRRNPSKACPTTWSWSAPTFPTRTEMTRDETSRPRSPPP